MSINASRKIVLTALTFALALSTAPAALAQDDTTTSPNSRTVASGQKMKVKGIVTRRDFERNTITVRDANGVDTTVQLSDATQVKQKGGFFGGSKTYPVTSVLRGLRVEVDGTGDSSGSLAARKVEFSEGDLRVAQSLEARVDPVETRVGSAEGRIGTVEQNAQRMSGQLDELAAISNAARGGAKAAQETADAAVGGVRATNERISALDDYEAQQGVTLNFRVNSAVLSPDARTQLDQIAQQALNAKGYVIEVSGHASSDGATDHNRRLSQRRADTVVRYLAENHRIPLRRIITPFGYGESQQVAENTTRAGREQNRRVDVRVLVNRGLLQGAPQMNTPSSQNPE
jgi:outer membrane protein OmpA-like peptidoglycan-associated protein